MVTAAIAMSAARIIATWNPQRRVEFAPKVTATEIDPGPTVNGSVNG